MAKRFEGKVAVVTGAGRGIGRETALLFAREGARVVVNDLGGSSNGEGETSPVAQQVVDEIVAAGGEAVAEGSSVSSMEGGKAVVEAALDRFGRLDFLVNNAGIVRPKPVMEMSEQDFDLVLAVNLKGYFATVRHAAQYLVRQGGAIVNYSSPSGWGHLHQSNYAAAKEGAVGFTRSIARELGEHGVRVNAIRPMAMGTTMYGPEVERTMTESERLGIPLLGDQYLSMHGIEPKLAHVAAVAVWLCAEESKPLNGREIFVAGSHVGLVQQPEIIRSHFDAKGWTLDALCRPDVVQGLTYNQRDLYQGPK